jgi:hypothetical protein
VGRYRFSARPESEVAVEVGGPMPALVALLREPRQGRGTAGNILAAVESVPGQPTPPLKATLPKKGRQGDPAADEFYVEIRHARPRVGTGEYTIRVRVGL